jgi:D-alanyl-D-alanine carboxypeptidase
MRRGNRHLIGVVLGGRSGGSRDATMRNLLAENLEKGATTRTVAAITERNSADANTDVVESRPADSVRPLPPSWRQPLQRADCPGVFPADGGRRCCPAPPPARPE